MKPNSDNEYDFFPDGVSRADFLRWSGAALLGAAGARYGLGTGELLARPAGKKILVHVVLGGGPDWRQVIVPPFSEKPDSYENAYWTGRKNVHIGKFSRTQDMGERYRNDYVELKGGNLGKFGVLKKAGWLIDQYRRGNVAVINNVRHSTNRNHSWSLLIAESGDMNAKESQADRDGWGGRLAAAMNSNILSMTPQVRLFCHPPASVSRNIIISAADSRDFGLYEPEIYFDKSEARGARPERYNSSRAKLHRALKSYYKQKSKTETNPVYRRFFEHEQKMRLLGRRVRANLARYPDYYNGIPAGGGRKDRRDDLKKFNLKGTFLGAGFGKQFRSLYDSIMCQDILNFNTASLSMGGWDTHKLQMDYMEPKINQIFGNQILDNKGKPVPGKYGMLKTLMELLPANKADDVVFVFSGDFGRQLKANGSRGTDHGRGNQILIVGNQVRGGMYGSLFPENEIRRYAMDNQDNIGLTGFDHVYGAVCDWMGGYGDTVFPGRRSAPIEKGGLLGSLFS